ncbi:MAG: MBL fold metallo-hydrolase [Anaerolineales bacterium]|jgi:glyoxylase-like metal-dependent hydrolase (beta-lactamase superfamily II)
MLRATEFGDVVQYRLARTLAGRGRYWTAAYYVDGLLVDTGCRYSVRELVEALADKPLERVVNTHAHEDHIGANQALLQQHPGLEILAHPAALPVLEDPRRTQPLNPYQILFWGYPAPSAGEAVSDAMMIETNRFRLQVVFTPGHSVDHICLYEPDQGWLFTGDLFVGGEIRALRSDSDVGQMVTSLKRVAELPAEWLFPASARARPNAAKELAAKIAYFEALEAKVLELHRRGRQVGEIARGLLGGPTWVEFVTLGHFSRRNLVRSFLQAQERG